MRYRERTPVTSGVDIVRDQRGLDRDSHSEGPSS